MPARILDLPQAQNARRPGLLPTVRFDGGVSGVRSIDSRARPECHHGTESCHFLNVIPLGPTVRLVRLRPERYRARS